MARHLVICALLEANFTAPMPMATNKATMVIVTSNSIKVKDFFGFAEKVKNKW